MFILIERYMSKLDKETVNSFALKNNIQLNESELDFTYDFVKKNWKTILSNHGMFDLDKYKGKFSEENFPKVQKLLKESLLKYHDYL